MDETGAYVETLYDGKKKAWTNMVRGVTSNAKQYDRPFKSKVEAVHLGCQASQILSIQHQIKSKDTETWETCSKH